MPLSSGKSRKDFSQNVKTEVAAGKPKKQAVAIAYAKQRGDADPEVELGDAINAAEKELAAKKRAMKGLSSNDSFEGLVEKLQRKGYSKAYATKIAGKVAQKKGDADIDVDCTAADIAIDAGRPRLAMDRQGTMRTKDLDGRMTVKDCKISKATVNPYLGSEINAVKPGLNLEPTRVYRMYREAAALEAAAASFERVPLMMKHVATTAAEPQKETIIGAVSNVRWQAPYLVADLTVWDAKGIEAIESERQQELSPGYRYEPIMTSGVIDGQPYDGLMAGPIVGNHVAIVDTGRTGPEVMVNDRATVRAA